ncbi:MAG: serine hydrolase [Bacteriovoracaceae bacterium]|jgi:CubicO group peptidase (beta-lactamase class C family)|nr:serine hydrolase [Bacteriovoracaceae bacterium]
MKKYQIKLMSYFFIVLLTNCSLFQNRNHQYSEKLSRIFQAGINMGDASSFYNEFDDQLRRKLPPPALQAFLAKVKSFCGRINTMGEVTLEKDGGVFYPRFSSGNCLIKYTHDVNLKISNFIIKPYKVKIPTFIQNKDHTFTKRVKDISDYYFKHTKLVGMAIGIIEKGKLSYIYKGHQHFSKKTPINENSIFEIGSISKTFTAVMLADAILNNKISANTKIKTLLPILKRTPVQNISLSSLSLHVSGLPKLPDDLPHNSDPYGLYDEKQLINFFKKSKYSLKITKQNKVKYSNLGVALLGVGLEKIYNKTYEEILQENIAMKGELVASTSDIDLCNRKALAFGHANEVIVPHWTFKAFKATGGIYSNIVDMTHFLKNLFTKTGLLNKHLSIMLQYKEKDTNQSTAHLGIFSKKDLEQEFYWHNGGTGGFSSFYAYDPKGEFGIVILNNAYDSPITELGMKIMTGR